jgi:hypothetical protein
VSHLRRISLPAPANCGQYFAERIVPFLFLSATQILSAVSVWPSFLIGTVIKIPAIVHNSIKILETSTMLHFPGPVESRLGSCLSPGNVRYNRPKTRIQKENYVPFKQTTKYRSNIALSRPSCRNRNSQPDTKNKSDDASTLPSSQK